MIRPLARCEQPDSAEPSCSAARWPVAVRLLALGDAMGPFFCSAAPQSFFRPGRRSRSRRAQGRSRLAAFAAAAGLALTGPSTAARWRGPGLHSSPAWNLPSVATYGCWARATSWRSVARRLQASPDCPIMSCRAEAPARRFLAVVASIAPRNIRSFAPPGRQSASHDRVEP